jgi:UDP-N-acetylmuramate dehydrogenase
MREYNDFELRDFNSYAVQAKCHKAIFPETTGEVVSALQNNENVILLGGGNNIILSKEWYENTFIIFNGNFDGISIVNRDNCTLKAQAGCFTKTLSEYVQNLGWSGAEFLYDIPSSVGGAVVMNAGTKEGETKSILRGIKFYDLDEGEIRTLSVDELDLGYRKSVFQFKGNGVVLEAEFQLRKGNKAKILADMIDSKDRRWLKQPRDLPNCGSVFKRPAGHFVGPMIEGLGLKGYRIGDAMVSQKHAGFIVNSGRATGRDILELIGYIKSLVKVEYGLDLEVEQRII